MFSGLTLEQLVKLRSKAEGIVRDANRRLDDINTEITRLAREASKHVN